MRLTRQAAVRKILSGIRARGWQDPESLAVTVVQRISESRQGTVPDLASVIPGDFLRRNGLPRSVVGDALETILQGVEVVREVAPPPMPTLLKVLFVAANPYQVDDRPLDEADRLRLDEEFRSIQQSLRATELRDAIELASRWAARPGDLIDAINEERPQILHFSGHGSDMDELVFQDDRGAPRYVSLDAISATISTVSDGVRLAVFNNCYSANAANAAVTYIEAAIVMNDSIGDEAARIFTRQLYSSLGYGLSLDRAFAQATAALKLEGIPEDQTPQLFTRPDVDASTLVLVRRQPPADMDSG